MVTLWQIVGISSPLCGQTDAIVIQMNRQTGRQSQRRNGTTVVPRVHHAHLFKAAVPRTF